MGVKPGYKRTEVGVIPEEWGIRPLAEVAEIRTGVAKNANISVSNPVAVHYLRVANVQDGYLDLSNMSQLQVAQEDLKRYAVLPGDVLMNEGGDLDKLGRGAVWRGEFAPCIHQNHVFVVRCRTSLSPDFLNIWTAAAPARRYFLVAGKQTTNLASINKTALGGLPVAIPAETEQRAIATALSDVDALLTQLDRLIAKKRDIKQAAMQQLLTGKTRLPGFDGEWEVKQLGDVFSISTGRSKSAYVVAGGMNWVVDMGSISTDGKLVVSKATNYSDDFLNAGDLVMPKDDIGGGGIIGRVGYINANRTYVLGDHVYRLTARCGNPLFMSYVINSHKINSELRKKVIGSAQLGLGRKSVVEQEIAFPALEEQTAIAALLSDLDAELAALEARRDKTRALKQGMMQELLTGRTRLV